MSDLSVRTAQGRAGVGWATWALAVVPAMFILPMYIFPLPFAPFQFGSYTGRRVMEILWLAGLLLAFGRPALRAASARIWSDLSLQTRIAAAILVGWGLLSALVSSAPPYALREWSLVTLLLVATVPLAAALTGRRQRALEVVALTLVLYAILTWENPLRHGFANPRFQGQALAVLTPALLFSSQSALALMAAPALAFGFLNGSRALMLTLLVVTVAAWVLWPDRARRVVPGVAALAAAIVLTGFFVWLGFDSSLEAVAQRGTTSSARVRMWLDSLGRFLDAPVLGVGPGLLARAPGVGGFAGHPHNSVLLIAAEWGIIGLGCACVLVVRGLRCLPQIAADRRPWALALIGGGFHSLLSGTIVMPASQAMLVLAIALAMPGTEGLRREQQPAQATAWILGGLGVVVLIILLSTFSLPPSEILPPRFGHRFFPVGIIP